MGRQLVVSLITILPGIFKNKVIIIPWKVIIKKCLNLELLGYNSNKSKINGKIMAKKMKKVANTWRGYTIGS
ncbi:MAG: hypothetical protein ACTSVK_07545 [Promethearchaeota archaeon]